MWEDALNSMVMKYITLITVMELATDWGEIQGNTALESNQSLGGIRAKSTLSDIEILSRKLQWTKWDQLEIGRKKYRISIIEKRNSGLEAVSY